MARGEETNVVIAAAAGVSIRTFYRWCREPEFCDEVERHRAELGRRRQAAEAAEKAAHQVAQEQALRDYEERLAAEYRIWSSSSTRLRRRR